MESKLFLQAKLVPNCLQSNNFMHTTLFTRNKMTKKMLKWKHKPKINGILKKLPYGREHNQRNLDYERRVLHK